MLPVGWKSLDDVHVAEKEHGLLRGGVSRAHAHDEILLVGVRTEQVYVLWREACIEEALLHRHGPGGHAALRRVGGVDFDELLENVAGFGAIRGRCSGQRR